MFDLNSLLLTKYACSKQIVTIKLLWNSSLRVLSFEQGYLYYNSRKRNTATIISKLAWHIYVKCDWNKARKAGHCDIKLALSLSFQYTLRSQSSPFTSIKRATKNYIQFLYFIIKYIKKGVF